MSYSSAILLVLFTPYERTPDLESVNNIKMLQFSKEWVKNSIVVFKTSSVCYFIFKNTPFFRISMKIYSNAKQFLKFHFPGQAIKVVLLGWIFR